MKSWTVDDIGPLDGRVAVVTGANSGLGFETSLALARSGAHVVLACRSTERAAAAVERLQQQVPDADTEVLALDLSDLGSVRTFVTEFLGRNDRIDLLINNAGVMGIDRQETADGFEMQFGTNHLGHFALTGLLLDRMLATPGARVVTVSSMGARIGRMRFDDLQGEHSYGKWSAYCQSKLANQLFALELDRRLAVGGADVLSVAAHPGYAATNLVYPQMKGSNLGRGRGTVGEHGARPERGGRCTPHHLCGDLACRSGWPVLRARRSARNARPWSDPGLLRPGGQRFRRRAPALEDLRGADRRPATVHRRLGLSHRVSSVARQGRPRRWCSVTTRSLQRSPARGRCSSSSRLRCGGSTSGSSRTLLPTSGSSLPAHAATIRPSSSTRASAGASPRSCATSTRLARPSSHRLGVKKGDRVAIAMRNLPEWVISFAAILSIGRGLGLSQRLVDRGGDRLRLRRLGATLLIADPARRARPRVACRAAGSR